MSSLSIRGALATDSEQIFNLSQRFATSFSVDNSAFVESLRQVLLSDDACLLVAEYNREVVGYCLAFDHPAFFANGRVTWVEEIMVSEEHRRVGIGGKLMNHIELWAQGRSSAIVALATRRAADFYSAVGYEESATYFRKVLVGA